MLPTVTNTGYKTFFHSNIRFLRERNGITQETLSKQIGVLRNKLQALESGKTVNPTTADLIKISNNFKISIDSLLKINLNEIEDSKLSELINSTEEYLSGANMRILAITVDQRNTENIEYVPIKAKAGYQAGCNDPEYIASLPKFNLPNLPNSGTFRMFPTTGDSMLPIPENSDVIGQYVQDWTTIKPQTPCIVILKGAQDFVFKLVTIRSDQQIELKSSNTYYKTYTVDATDVLEIWKYYRHQTGTIPEQATSLEELKEMILDLGSRLPKQ